MRNCLAVTLLACALAGLVLAGCQGGKGEAVTTSATQEAAPAPSPSPAPALADAPAVEAPFPGSTGIFDARREEAFKTLFGNVLTSCIEQLPANAPSGEMIGCLNGGTIAAIEPSGHAIRHCRNDANMETSLSCALSGALLLKMREEAKAGISDSGWQNLDATVGQEMVVISIDETMACTREGKRAGEPARICYADRLTNRFDIAPEDGRACLRISDEWDFSQCLGEAAALTILEAAARKSAPAS